MGADRWFESEMNAKKDLEETGKMLVKAETRPCRKCKGLGYFVDESKPKVVGGKTYYPGGPCPESLCNGGQVPRDYAMRCEGISRMVDEVGYRDDVDPYEWARVKSKEEGK